MSQNSPDTKILDQAALSFRRSPEVRTALNWFRTNPEQFRKIAEQFDEIIKNMNFILKGDEPIDKSNFGGLARLKESKVNRLPFLEELAGIAGKGSNQKIVDVVIKTFTEIGTNLQEGGDWHWATQETPKVMASGLLIEAYGRFLSQRHDGDNIKRNFVLGFEETGWAFARNSGIMQDVKQWMIEEADTFSPIVRNDLRGRTSQATG